MVLVTRGVITNASFHNQETKANDFFVVGIEFIFAMFDHMSYLKY
jgi:hypothetical protein